MNDLIAIPKIAQWQKLKTLVPVSVSSPITKRVYNMALDEFYGWFQEAPRPGFTKATVSAWRVSLEARGLGSSSIIIGMSGIRKLAGEAAAKRCPAELYTTSPRIYSGIPEPHYPFHDRTIVITSCGRLCLYNKKINLSLSLAGQAVGV